MNAQDSNNRHGLKVDTIINTSGKLASICLVLYVGLVPLNSLTFAGIGSIYKFFVLGIAAILIMLTITGDYFRFESGITAWGFYIAYMGMSVIWAENKANSLSFFIGMLQIYVISLLFLQRKYTTKQHDYIKCAIVFAGVVFICLQLMYSSQQIYTGRNVISFGTLGSMDPNEFCGYLILPIAVCMQAFFKSNGIKKIASIGIVVLFLYSIMIAGSRGGLSAAAITIVVIVFKSGRFSLRKFAAIIILAIVILVLFTFVIIPNLPDTVLHRFTQEGIQQDGGSGRIDIWLETLEMLWNNPLRLLFGCGVFGATSAPYCSHNMLIQVLLDGGILGFLTYIVFMTQIIKRLKYKENYIVAAFWGIQALMLTLSAYAWFKAVWIIYLLCLINFDPRVKEKTRGTTHKQKGIIV